MTEDLDMGKAIVPKSDQMNSDDLLAGPLTITITKMEVRGDGEQKVSVYYDGDKGKPFKPCKSMCRIMVLAWGKDANLYIGKSMTLYNDPSVKWGGMEVGGIRISHMSDIGVKRTVVLTATKGSKKPFTVLPLVKTQPTAPSIDDCLADIASSPNLDGLAYKFKAALTIFTSAENRAEIIAAKDKRKAELSAPPPVTDHLEELIGATDSTTGEDNAEF